MDNTPEPDEPQERPAPAAHPITIIGCIKGINGWYRAGFDEDTKTIIPLERVK